ncbi:MAG: hypothetical protein J7539_17560, partial [Niabella sp.]|nr:hypothetical protein [Niabella sp.]
MEKLHFAQFLSDNSFIGVNDNSTIADLLKKKLQNQDAKIIIKKDDDYLIYPHGKALINFLGEQHPDTKIKNVGSLTGLSGNMPWVISGDLPSGTQQFLDGIVDHRAGDAKTFFPNAINGLVSNYFSDGNLVTDKASYNIIDTVNNAGHYDWTDTGEDIKVGNMPQSEPPPEPQSDIKTQPYYLVSEFPETVSQNTVFTLNVFLSRDQLAKASPALLLQDGWQIDILVHARSGVQLTGDSQGVIVVSSKSIDQKIPFALKTLDGDKGIFNVMAIHEGVV